MFHLSRAQHLWCKRTQLVGSQLLWSDRSDKSQILCHCFPSGVNFMKRYLLMPCVLVAAVRSEVTSLCVYGDLCVCACVYSYPYCPGCQSASCIFTFLLSSTKYWSDWFLFYFTCWSQQYSENSELSLKIFVSEMDMCSRLMVTMLFISLFT